MRDIQELLAYKQEQAARVEREIELLRAAIQIMEAEPAAPELRPATRLETAQPVVARAVGEWP
jgi:hypothetical protein